MIDIMQRSCELIITYTDSLGEFQGFLAIDALSHKVAAGGMRVQKGLTADRLAKMARNMTLKQRIGGMCVDGAKCGIDYDPNSPGKHGAMKRFMIAIRPYMHERYSMGPDLNTKLPEIDAILNEIGIPSAKMAVALAQGMTLEHFLVRYNTFQEKVDGFTLGQRRSGHGVAMACLGALEILGIPPKDATVTIQGFGGLGSGAAFSLYKAGVKIIAIADDQNCLICQNGLNIERLMAQSDGTHLPKTEALDYKYNQPAAIFDIPCDAMIPAAVENVIDCPRAQRMPAKAVVEGANLPASPEAEGILKQRGILVVPDFVAGSAGSLSVDGLFGPPQPVDARYVLDHIEWRMRSIVKEVVSRSEKDHTTTRQAALDICSEVKPNPEAKPYGHFLR
ncbi:MAG: Glu/Leu/Phe/Val dehydrogenase [Candidatus Schekmanbacteria bacterium]|nr:Glu/Leu/Phe/Val dehydrogenase [Candidatus Schekmanbacteria bacterium]